jgi:hypothetical protein
MRGSGKSAANRPAWVLACSAAVVVGTIGALDFLDGSGPQRPTHHAPARVAQAPAGESAAPENPVEARQHFHQYSLAIERALVSSDPRQRETAFAVLLPELLAAEPAAAVGIFARQPPGEAREALRAEMARRWVMQDRESALAWFETLEEPDRRAAATIAVQSLAARAPADAIAAAHRFGVGRDDGSLEHIARIWAEDDPDAARRWAEQQSDPRNVVLRARILEVTERALARER